MNEKEKAFEDLKVIRQIVDQTKAAIDPSAPIIITWGILTFLGNINSFIITKTQSNDMYYAYNWWGISVIGLFLSMYFGFKIGIRRYKTGINHYVSRQLALFWTIIVPTGVVWSIIGPHFNIFPYETLGILWGILYSIAIYSMGIIYSKEFLFGGIVIFIGTISAGIFMEVQSLLLGISMGAGTTIPGIIAHRRFKKTMRDIDEGRI